MNNYVTVFVVNEVINRRMYVYLAEFLTLVSISQSLFFLIEENDQFV